MVDSACEMHRWVCIVLNQGTGLLPWPVHSVCQFVGQRPGRGSQGSNWFIAHLSYCPLVRWRRRPAARATERPWQQQQSQPPSPSPSPLPPPSPLLLRPPYPSPLLPRPPSPSSGHLQGGKGQLKGNCKSTCT